MKMIELQINVGSIVTPLGLRLLAGFEPDSFRSEY